MVLFSKFKGKFARNNKKATKALVFPLFLLYFCVLLGIAGAAAVITGVIVVLPSYLIHIYSYGRALYWWRKSRVKRMLPKH